MKVLLCLAVAIAVAVADQSCTSDADCSEEECCLHPLFGKRFLFDGGFGHTSGTCTALSKQGESCEPPEIHDPFNPKLHEWHCPCVKGFECHGEKEIHNSGSHSYTNPKCISADAMTTPQSTTS